MLTLAPDGTPGRLQRLGGDEEASHGALYGLDLADPAAEPERLLREDDADLIQPALSPDGLRLACARRSRRQRGWPTPTATTPSGWIWTAVRSTS